MPWNLTPQVPHTTPDIPRQKVCVHDKKDHVTQGRSADALYALATPTLCRAGVALAFAAATIFIPHPSQFLGAWLLALWFAGTGLSILWTRRASANYPSLELAGLEASQSSAAVLALLLAPAIIIINNNLGTLTLVLSVGFIVMALPDVWIGSTRGKNHPLGKDWILTGLVSAGCAIGVLLVSSLDMHAVLGVTGGGAIICGVFLLIAGLSLRYEAKNLPPSSGR